MFKTTKSKIIFVIIFSVICIGLTAILVLYKNIDIENEEPNLETMEKPTQNDVAGIDLKGTYDQNDLELEERTISKDKIEIRYYQINGLKDKTIQDKINKELEILALNCYKDKVQNLEDVINVSVNMWNSGNFANTISFDISFYAKINDNSDDYYNGIWGLNYDLTTGEKITIDKMFTSDAPIENILRSAAYYSLIPSLAEENLNGEFIINDYGEIEDEIAEFINAYKKGRITEFYYTPRYINIYYGENKIVNIDMAQYAEYIAIYHRYLADENIFEKNDIGLKNVYTLTSRINEYRYYVNYRKQANYFIDIAIDCQEGNEDQFGKNLANEKIKAIEAEIEKVKQLSKQNPNNFYILNYYINIYTGEEWSTKQMATTYYEYGNTYEMTVHDFEENIEPIIIEYNRQEFSGEIPNYVYNFSNMLKLEPQKTKEIYNTITGEKIVI